MRIEYVHLVNYKGFRDSGRIVIGKKFTVLIGQNNAGKTAFLEAMSTETFQDKPFKKAQELPERFPQVLNPKSQSTFGVSFTGKELKWRLLATGTQIQMSSAGETIEEISEFVHSFFAREYIKSEAVYTPRVWLTSQHPSLPLSNNPANHAFIEPTADRQNIHIPNLSRGAAENIVPLLIGPYIQAATYVFRAERMNIGQCSIEGGVELKPDASNLASVLLHLQGNPTALGQFTSCIRAIFPTVHSIVSIPIANTPSVARIEVINRDDRISEPYPGISIPLADSGTGIGQVLAIIYVAITAQTPRVIVIDEPNSFLHPGAAKKLIAILRNLDHQYIITTHSPEIIRAAAPEVLHLVRWTQGEIMIETLSSEDINDIRRALDELGVRLSDVFGADNILWVEGPTEEICFPLLLRQAGHVASAATNVVAIINTGDLESRRPRNSLSWEVYERLTTSNSLIPPALAFILDREDRTPRDIDDMIRRSRGKVHFLPRRTYENYLLDAEAISAVLRENEIDKYPAEVQAWIDKHGARRKYFTNAAISVNDQQWPILVNAPRLLGELFDHFSGHALQYRKTVHSVALSEWLISNNPAAFRELIEYVVTVAASPARRPH